MQTYDATRLLALILSLWYEILSQEHDFHMSHQAICCSNLSWWRVAALCRIVLIKLDQEEKLCVVCSPDTLRAEVSSIFLEKSGKGRNLCQLPRLSLICRSSTDLDESVRFKASFYCFTAMRIFLDKIADLIGARGILLMRLPLLRLSKFSLRNSEKAGSWHP